MRNELLLQFIIRISKEGSHLVNVMLLAIEGTIVTDLEYFPLILAMPLERLG